MKTNSAKDGRLLRTESVTTIIWRALQAVAIVVAGAWTYNKWIKVEEPERQWVAIQRDLAQRVTGRVEACLTPIELGGSTLISLEIYVVNTGRVHLGIDTIESYVEWTEPASYRSAVVAQPDFDFLLADTAALDQETLAPLGILAPSDSAHGSIDFVLRPEAGGVYRFHAQLYLKPVDADSAGGTIVQDSTRSKPWHTWATWAPGKAGTCPGGAPL